MLVIAHCLNVIPGGMLTKGGGVCARYWICRPIYQGKGKGKGEGEGNAFQQEKHRYET